MGKKPVITLAGLFLASAVLCGCKGNQGCNNGMCGGPTHLSAGQTLNNGRATVSQPGGTMPTGTAVGSSTPGFNTTSVNSVGGSSMSTGLGATGNPSQRSTGMQPGMLGTQPGAMGGSLGSSSLSPGMTGRTTLPAQDAFRSPSMSQPSLSGGQTIGGSGAGLSGGTGSGQLPRITTTGSEQPEPVGGTSGQSKYNGSMTTPGGSISTPSNLDLTPPPSTHPQQ
jgi:hypothetical protein